MQLEVDVPPDEDAVVLLERDGVYSWHLPVDTGRRTTIARAGPPDPTLRDRRAARSADAPADPDGRRDRGLLGHVIEGAAHALVFRFVAPALLEKAVEKMEAHVKTGLVHLTDAEVSGWKRFETLDELHLPTDRPVRVLLFIHGTFSSTAGGFGALAVEAARCDGFLRMLIQAYDAVIGFDHKTLSVDPQQNAEDLLERLKTHQPGAELVIDVITHSRGGLTTRSFVEQVLPPSGWPARVDNIVFVASTHAGTNLASPERWSDLVDVYTNLAAVSAKVLSLAGAGAVGAVVGGVVKGIGAFVKYLVSYAAEGDDVPGLKAMVPAGAFVTEINKLQPGQPGPGTNWFVVSSNFHVSLFDDSHNPPEFPQGAGPQARGGLRRPAVQGRQRPGRGHRLDVGDRRSGAAASSGTPSRWARTTSSTTTTTSTSSACWRRSRAGCRWVSVPVAARSRGAAASPRRRLRTGTAAPGRADARGRHRAAPWSTMAEPPGGGDGRPRAGARARHGEPAADGLANGGGPARRPPPALPARSGRHDSAGATRADRRATWPRRCPATSSRRPTSSYACGSPAT